MRGLLAGAGAAAGLGWLWGRYRRDRLAALQRLRESATIITTAAGPIEYTTAGTGPAVIVAHGILGSYEHALLSTLLLQDRFQVIAPSRPGYGRTPLRTGRSAAEQAHAYAALLDALKIDRAALIGISGAGPSAICFAGLYPQRCAGLILLCAVSRPLDVRQQRLSQALSLFLRLRHFDLLMWLAVNTVVNGLPLLRFINPDLKRRIYDDPQAYAQFAAIMHSFFPATPGQDGFANDLEIFEADIDYALTHIHTPTLVMHGEADSTIPPDEARYTAAQIAGARLVLVGDRANHPFYVTHAGQVWPVIAAFLDEHLRGS